jgi:biopolymer transport protein ExbB
MQSFNLIEMWHNMAPLAKAVNVLLAICSVYSLWVIVDRFFGLRSVKKKSVAFVVALRDQLKYRNIDGAMQLAAQKNDSPISRLVHEALVEYREGSALGPGGEYDPVEAVERVVERTKEREVADLKRGLGGLASISSAAPFIGLFGTVVGIINAFRAMAATGQGGLGAVSAGISEALFTTAVGLMVAIPAVMTFNYFSTVIERFTVDMNGVGSELVSFILRESAAMAPVHHQSQHPPPSMHPSQHPQAMRPGSMHPGPGSVHGPAAPRASGHGPAAKPGYPTGYNRR